MTAAVLGAAAGAVAVTIGRGAAAALGNGLSFAAELAKAAGKPSAPPDVPTKRANGLSVELSQRIRELTERIRQRLEAASIRLTQPMELVSDGLGGIAVSGSHPQQAAIEQAIGSDVLLQRDFARLASDYREEAAQTGDIDLPASLTITIHAAP